MLRHVHHGPGQRPRNRPWPTVLATLLAALSLAALLGAPALAAPPGPADLSRSIETARVAIAGHEKTIVSYDAEMRSLTGNDPASALVQNAASADSEALVLSWPSVTGRIYAIHSTDVITNGFTNTVQSNIPDSAPLNTATVDVSGLMGLSFYRIAAERP